jgi:uncharacterized cysteine cluster protein YcgN (CxxCxxCC family)
MSVYTCQRCSTDTEAIERHGIDWLCPTCAYVENSLEGRTDDFEYFVRWEPVSLAEMQRDDTQYDLERFV